MAEEQLQLRAQAGSGDIPSQLGIGHRSWLTRVAHPIEAQEQRELTGQRKPMAVAVTRQGELGQNCQE